MNVKAVLANYIMAALGTEIENGYFLDRKYNRGDIHPITLKRMSEDVNKFVNENHEDLCTWNGGRTTIEEQAGHDFWLTRNGHGAGFWEDEWGDVGQRLSNAAKAFGTFNLYLGDDGLIHGFVIHGE